MNRLPFNKTLLDFLVRAGYTHMQDRGIEKNPESIAGHDDNYILVPRKAGMFAFEDSDLIIETIDSTAITDMLDLEFGVDFWVELPAEEVSRYEASIKKG